MNSLLSVQVTDEGYMQQALLQAEQAAKAGEIPVGAIIVIENRIIAKAHNMVERLQDVTAHAEILALTSAFQYVGSKYLPQATLYVTLEPCLMCAGALYWSKIGRVVFADQDEKNGYHTHCPHSPFHPKTNVEKGVMVGEGARLMKQFFANKR